MIAGPARTLSLRVCTLLLAAVSSLAAAGAPPPGSVIYEIYVRAFQDSDGDGVGDIPGVTSRLDYLEWLGVTDLWLMPVNPSPSEHGYDPVDYLGVDDEYGTPSDLDELLAATEARGMRVILDLVVNHTSDRHPWFQAAANGDPVYRDYYVWRDVPPDWQGLGAGSPWHASGGAYYLGLFTGSQPDLNHRNPAVRAELERAARHWLERGVDGFRVDAIQHIVEGEEGVIRNAPETFEWVRRFGEFVESVSPEAYLLGETWTGSPTIARYHAEAGLDLSTNYPLWEDILDSVQRRSPAGLAAVLEQDERLYPADAARAPFISNHDQVRPASRFGFLRSDPERLRLAAGLLLASPGIPILYYGEEIGMPNGEGDDDRMKRTPMRWEPGEGAGFTAAVPWRAFSTTDPAVTVAAQMRDPDSLLNWYRRLVAVRRSSAALKQGTLEVVDSGEPGVLAFRRRAQGEEVVVLANFAARGTSVDLAILAPGGTDLLSGESVSGRVELQGTSLRLLRVR